MSRIPGERIKDDYDGNSNLLRICQQRYENIETLIRPLPERAAITYPTTTRIGTEETRKLEDFRQAQASDYEC